MLYIWPYITFFSFPIVLPYILNAFLPQGLVPRFTRYGPVPPPRIVPSLAIMTTMLLIVHFNTIVHPFTLADNRHYVFYVFRYLMLYPWIKYAAVPVYFICGWATVAALGSLPQTQKTRINRAAAAQGNLVSFVLVWLAVTALSLVTVPLVEPRYMILPWIIWRIHVKDVAWLVSQSNLLKSDRRANFIGTTFGNDMAYVHKHSDRISIPL